MRLIFSIVLLLISLKGISQVSASSSDTKYLEDQFYIGITYNLLLDTPDQVSQNNLSNGIFLGYIKDMPINAKRNQAIGIGLGYNLNTYFSNLVAIEEAGVTTFEQINSSDFKKNRLTTHILEMPIEYRWRTSTPNNHKFWRIYTGVRLGYIFANSSRFENEEVDQRFNNDGIERFQYGLHFSFGYNTWNFYTYYDLGQIFKSDVSTIEGEAINTKNLKIGLMFYIL